MRRFLVLFAFLAHAAPASAFTVAPAAVVPGAPLTFAFVAPGVALNANVTVPPGATVAGAAVKARATGPGVAPPLPSDA